MARWWSASLTAQVGGCRRAWVRRGSRSPGEPTGSRGRGRNTGRRPAAAGVARGFLSIQAVEAIKLILGIGDTLSGRLLAYDSLEQSFRTYKMLRDPQCPACSIDPADIVIAEYDELGTPHPVRPPA